MLARTKIEDIIELKETFVMTESFDESAEHLFAAESERFNNQLSAIKAMGIVTAKLDTVGAPYLYVPFDDENTSNRTRAHLEEQIAAHQAEGTAYDMVSLELSIAKRMVSETTMLAQIAMVITANESKPLEEDASHVKKTLMAQALIYGLDTKWQDVIDQLVAGDRLDLSKNEDLELYAQTAIDNIDNPYSDTMRRVQEIMIEGFNPEDKKTGGELMITSVEILHKILSAKNNVTKRANTEAYLDELQRDGIITPEQSRQLRDLL